MIYFEHKVLSFGTTNKREIEAMDAALQEWGAAGYEVVSAVPTQIGGATVTVFLKREAFADDKDQGQAA